MKQPDSLCLPISRRFGISLLAIALLMITIAFAMVIFRATPSPVVSVGTKAVVSNRTLFKAHTIRYPVFHDHMLDTIISSYVQRKINHFETSRIGGSDVRNQLDITYVLSHYGRREASVIFMTRERVIGRPDVVAREHIVIDLAEKRQINAEDIIQQTPEARGVFSRLLYRALKQQITPALTPAESVALLEMPLSSIGSVSLEATTLTVSLNPRAPSSQTGVSTIAINRNVLREVLADRYDSDDPDVTAVHSRKPDYQITTSPSSEIVHPAGKLLALTFDDGPGDRTAELLTALETYEGHATFFVLGHLVETYAPTLQRMVREGNEIGNHSWNHANLRFLSPAGLDQQVLATQQAIQSATGHTPTRMRPPYGATDMYVYDYLAHRSLSQALWNVDTQDWHARDTTAIYERIMAEAGDGRVILLHDIYPTSVDAARRAIRDLTLQGYQLVTLSQLEQHR